MCHRGYTGIPKVGLKFFVHYSWRSYCDLNFGKISIFNGKFKKCCHNQRVNITGNILVGSIYPYSVRFFDASSDGQFINAAAVLYRLIVIITRSDSDFNLDKEEKNIQILTFLRFQMPYTVSNSFWIVSISKFMYTLIRKYGSLLFSVLLITRIKRGSF